MPDSTVYYTWIFGTVENVSDRKNQGYPRKFRYHMDIYPDLNHSISSVTEKRGKPRMKCAYPAVVIGHSKDRKKFEENATVLNLSASGVYVVLDRFIENGQDVSLKIAVPTGSLEWGSSKLTSNGVVVRTEAISEGILGVAVSFQHYRFV